MKSFSEQLPSKKESSKPEKGELVQSGSFSVSEKINQEDIFKALREIRKGKEAKNLSEVERKIQTKEDLSREDLIFLYGTDIKGFKYERDPRIKEIINGRDLKKDLLSIFSKDQIAHNPKEINEKTEIYVGELKPGIFDLIQEYGIDLIYTSFPKGKISKETLEIGGQTKEELFKELKKQKQQEKLTINDYVGDTFQNKNFTVLEKKEDATLICLAVDDLFNDNKNHTTKEIYEKVEEFGLELCPSEVGPKLRLKYQDQPLNEWLYIGMKQISVPDGFPIVFKLERTGGGLWLNRNLADLDDGWYPGDRFVFRLRKLETKKL